MLLFVISNHAILYAPHDNSNPLSIQTHSKVHYLSIHNENCMQVGMLATYAYIVIVICKYSI